METVQIPVHRLKAALSPTLARAAAGDVIVVTSHGKAVARITGAAAPGQPGLAKLLASGSASWAGGKPKLRPPLTLAPGGASLGDQIIEDRG